MQLCLSFFLHNKKLKIEPKAMFCSYYFLKRHLAYWQGKRKKNNYSFTTSVAFPFSPNLSEHLSCKINNHKQLSSYFVSDEFTKQMFGQKNIFNSKSYEKLKLILHFRSHRNIPTSPFHTIFTPKLKVTFLLHNLPSTTNKVCTTDYTLKMENVHLCESNVITFVTFYSIFNNLFV